MNEGLVEKFDLIGPKDQKLPFQSVSEKIKENNFHQQKKDFFKYWSPYHGNIGFKKNMNERISFPLNRKSIATNRNKELV